MAHLAIRPPLPPESDIEMQNMSSQTKLSQTVPIGVLAENVQVENVTLDVPLLRIDEEQNAAATDAEKDIGLQQSNKKYILESPYEEFLVNVHTLARDLDPQGPDWPVPLLINKKDTPKTINAKFKKTYGYSIDSLMIEPDSWENDETDVNEPKFFKHSGCWSCFRGTRRQDWVLRHEHWAIEVRIHT